MRFLKVAFTTKLWLTVLVAIVIGAAMGLIWPDAGAAMEPVGTTFIALIKMLIGPVIFCTIVTGIAAAEDLTNVGRVGVKALVYFEVVTTIALIFGLVVMDIVRPGEGLGANPDELKLSDAGAGYAQSAEATHWYDFIVNIVPHTVVSAFSEGNVLQILLISVLAAVSLRMIGKPAAGVVHGIEIVGEATFNIVRMVMYLSPIGAFGAIAYAAGEFGLKTLSSLASFVGLFWISGILFSLVIFGIIARMIGLRILPIMRYFKDEYFITLGTSNYEAVMPQLMKKLERLGVRKDIVGVVVPSGYAFNGDGVCLYLGFASLFIGQAFGIDLSLGEQIALLAVFLITSKGSAGVAGAGFIVLAATLSATGTVPVVGIMLILGVDRFMSTMRGLVSLTGQMMGSLVVARWEKELPLDVTRTELKAGPPPTAQLLETNV